MIHGERSPAEALDSITSRLQINKLEIYFVLDRDGVTEWQTTNGHAAATKLDETIRLLRKGA